MSCDDFAHAQAARLSSPAAERNRQPILEVLQAVLADEAEVLELASGSGEHALHCSTAMPGWRWQPSDMNDAALASIEGWRVTLGGENFQPPLRVDVTGEWPTDRLDAIVAINLIHISPWEVTEALMTRAEQRLVSGGVLFLYGPYRRDGQHTASSNAAFDADLKRRDPSWGVRELETVLALAERHGLKLDRVVEMPANNLSVVLRRT